MVAVAAASAERGVQPWSWRQLLLLFLVALSLFCSLRWDGARWLQQELHGVGIDAVVVTRNGITLHLEQVTLSAVTVDGALLQLREMSLRPIWSSSWLHLQPVVAITARWRQAVVDAEVMRMDGERLALRALQLQLPLPMVMPWLPALPVALDGDVACHGALQLLLAERKAAQPDLRCDWRQASAAMGGGTPMALGSYHLQLRSRGEKWHWSLGGGDVARVNGEGVIHPAATLAMSQWPLDGKLTVQAGTGAFGAMVGAVLGGASHTIAGTLAAPQLR